MNNMKTVKLTESDIRNIVKRVINEESPNGLRSRNPRIMRTAEPPERNVGEKVPLDRISTNIHTPDKYETRKEFLQNVIDRLMRYDKRYMREVERLNNEFPINPDYFGRYSYDDVIDG